MQVTIPKRFEGALQAAVDSGRYSSIDDVVLDAIRTWAAQESALDWLKAKVEAGEQSGEAIPDTELDAWLDKTLGPAA
jgi:putative addiction module CopG family antidote